MYKMRVFENEYPCDTSQVLLVQGLCNLMTLPAIIAAADSTGSVTYC